MAMPATTLASRFSLRGVIVGVALTIAVVIAVAFGLDSQGVLRSPLVIVTPLVLVLSVLILGTPIMYSDIEHRTGATLDALTGLLNRKALEELAERGRGEAMGLIVADVDHFKQINNRHGPARGDRVLPEVAALLQAHLRGGDLAFRLGGEEFLVLLPGSSQAVAADLAERIRSAIRECAIDRDLRIALSLGVAAAEGSECPRYEELFRRADGALYLAKQRGRNRACAEGSQTSVIAR
jgi:diguanylate cyclase (GGDEF)-like protein